MILSNSKTVWPRLNVGQWQKVHILGHFTAECIRGLYNEFLYIWTLVTLMLKFLFLHNWLECMTRNSTKMNWFLSVYTYKEIALYHFSISRSVTIVFRIYILEVESGVKLKYYLHLMPQSNSQKSTYENLINGISGLFNFQLTQLTSWFWQFNSLDIFFNWLLSQVTFTFFFNHKKQNK